MLSGLIFCTPPPPPPGRWWGRRLVNLSHFFIFAARKRGFAGRRQGTGFTAPPPVRPSIRRSNMWTIKEEAGLMGRVISSSEETAQQTLLRELAMDSLFFFYHFYSLIFAFYYFFHEYQPHLYISTAAEGDATHTPLQLLPPAAPGYGRRTPNPSGPQEG